MSRPRRIRDPSLPPSWHLKQSSCPACGTPLNATSAHDHAKPPKPGDFTICLRCSTLLRYDASLQPRRLAAGELEAAGAAEPELLRDLTLARLKAAMFNRRTTH